MTVNDIWGRIVIEKEYEDIINSKEFSSLKQKTQLGLNSNINATHTRYQHSIGTYYMACKLIEICKRKFSDILNIDKDDERAIKVMALVHDIGHGCFSHVSEKQLEGTHEDRTEKLLLDPNTEIHKAIVDNFGQSVLEKTVYLLKLKEKVKSSGTVEDSKNLVFVICKLLSGGIDIDRIDYIYRDSRYALGEENDFSSILDSIELESIDGALEVVFDGDAEFKIANFFNKRFELYDTLYLNSSTRILEEIFDKFLKEAGIKLNWDTSEVEMNNIFREHLDSSNPILRRYSGLLSSRKIDNAFAIKEYDDESKFKHFIKRLLSRCQVLERYPEVIFQDKSKVSVYNKANIVFVNKQGIIQDISDSSKILNSSLQKEKYVIAIDTRLLAILLRRDNVPKKEIDDILKEIERLMAPEIEQEKKYVFTENVMQSPEDAFEEVKTILGLSSPKIVQNQDVYYDHDSILESYRIAIRKRVCNGKVEWTVKRPIKDKTSLSKRDEKNFSSKEQVIDFLNSEWNIPIRSLEEVITLNTTREKYYLEKAGGIYEVVFDRTIPYYRDKKYPEQYMIECELKEGSSSGLFVIDSLIKKLPFIRECNNSKKERALSLVAKDKQANKEIDISPDRNGVVYDKELATFFVGNTKLLDNLRYLDRKKNEIRKLREKYGDLKTPIVVTVSGSPRAGKTTCVDNLTEFLRKADLRVSSLVEPAGMIYETLKSRSEKKTLLQDRVGFVDKQYDIGTGAIHDALGSSDVIICDRGAIDPFVWYEMYHALRMMDDERYYAFLQNLKKDKAYIECFYPLYAESRQAMQRDYLNSLSIEPRSTMSSENIERYNSALLRMLPVIGQNCDTMKLIDTTNLDRMDASIEVADSVLERIRRMY